MGKEVFINLHQHSAIGSTYDAMCQSKDLVDLASIYNSPSVAISDHHSIASWPTIFKLANKAGLKPICSIEFYFMWHDRLATDKGSYHLLATAMNETGYKNILKLIYKSQIDVKDGGGFFVRGKISEKMLLEHKEGLCISSACLGSPLGKEFMKGNDTNAYIAAEFFRDNFNPFYIEIMPNRAKIQGEVNRKLVKLAHDLNIPLITTLDVHFKDQSYADAYQAFGDLRRNRTLSFRDDPDADCIINPDFTIRPLETLYENYREQGIDECVARESIYNTVLLDKEINFTWNDRKFDMPNMSENADEELRQLIAQGLREKFGSIKNSPKEYIDRVKYELETIKQRNFSNYFLVIQDVLKYCDDNGIVRGPGRGSVGGCLIAYLIGISAVDPIRYSLPYERFLNPLRESALDIDSDITSEGRTKVINYLKNKYGEKNVLQICNYSEIRPKVALSDCAKYLEIPFDESKRITALIPSKNYDDDGNLQDVSFKEALKIPEIKSYKLKYPKLFELAEKMEGCFKTVSCHAGGVLILPRPADEIVPVMKKRGDNGADILMSSWDKLICEDVGLVKIDVLGLSSLMIIAECERLTGMKSKDLPENDENTWKFFADAKYMLGVFQLINDKSKAILREIKPRSIEDLSMISTALRPGSDLKTFLSNRHAKKIKYKFNLPEVVEVLKDTCGSILYQDQLLFLPNKLAGFSLGLSDNLRRSLEKQKTEEIAKYEKMFLEQCKYPDQAQDIFDWMKESAGYLFCLPEGTKIQMADCSFKNIEDVKQNDELLSVDEKYMSVIKNKCINLYDMGEKSIMSIETESGKILESTYDHRILTESGYKKADEIGLNDYVICFINERPIGSKVCKIKYNLGCKNVYDISMKSPYHNFIANDVVVHNCHAHSVAYSILSFWCGYYKSNYPKEFYVANLRHPKSNAELSEPEYIEQFVDEARRQNIEIELPKINNAFTETTIGSDGKIYLGLSIIKGISDNSAKVIASVPKTSNFKEWCEHALAVKNEHDVNGKTQLRTILNKGHIKSLVKIGFFCDNPKDILQDYKDIFEPIPPPRVLKSGIVKVSKANEKATEFRKELDKEFDQSIEILVNEAIGFEFYNKLKMKLAEIAVKFAGAGGDKYLDTSKYLLIHIESVKKGKSASGYPWTLIKAKSNNGNVTGFWSADEEPEKDGIFLVRFEVGKGDALSIKSAKRV